MCQCGNMQMENMVLGIDLLEGTCCKREYGGNMQLGNMVLGIESLERTCFRGEYVVWEYTQGEYGVGITLLERTTRWNMV